MYSFERINIIWVSFCRCILKQFANLVECLSVNKEGCVRRFLRLIHFNRMNNLKHVGKTNLERPDLKADSVIRKLLVFPILPLSLIHIQMCIRDSLMHSIPVCHGLNGPVYYQFDNILSRSLHRGFIRTLRSFQSIVKRQTSLYHCCLLYTSRCV